MLRDDASAQNGERHWHRPHLTSHERTAPPPTPYANKKGDPGGSPFNSGTDQKNQLKVIVDDPYLYRSSFSFAAS